jgi:BTB/POZ domain
MLKIDKETIDTCVHSNPNLLACYNNYRPKEHLVEERKAYPIDIAKVANSVLAIAEFEARQGRVSVQWDHKTAALIPASLVDQVNDIIRSKFNILTVVQKIFKTCYNINTELSSQARCFSIELSWPADHALLNPKPTYPVDAIEVETCRKTYFSSLFGEDTLADIQVSVEDKIIQAHKIMLAQCPYFKVLLTVRWKEIENNVIPITQCSYSTFFNFLNFLYKQEVTEKYFEKANHCLDMLEFVDLFGYESLKKLSKAHIFSIIDEQNFLDIQILQMKLGDLDLGKLCQWFLSAHPKFGEQVDFSSLLPMQLVTAYQIGQANKAENLVKLSLEELKKKLVLDDSFIELCKCIKKMKDPRLKSTLVEVLKLQPELCEEMKLGKKEKYKLHWKAFSSIMLDITF